MPVLSAFATIIIDPMNKINIERILGSLPVFKSFLPLARINKFTESLRKDPRFGVEIAGRSSLGKPIYHVRFGRGGTKVLFAGFPHPNEPVGGLTTHALLTLLKDGCPELAGRDIEWHVIPCATPDGAARTEGWTLQPFSFQRFMRYYFRKDHCHDLESSFPIKYGKMNFRKPVPETRAVMEVLRSARPDLYYSLHNASQEGAFFLVGRELGAKYYSQFYRLMRRLKIPLYTGQFPLAVKKYSAGVYSEILIRSEYDSLKKFEKDPTKYIRSGATPVEYLREYNKDAFSFICEFPHMKRPLSGLRTASAGNRRRDLLRGAADRLFLASVLLCEWAKVKKEVNRKSPFYTQIATGMRDRAQALKDPRFSAKTLADASTDRPVLKSEEAEENLQAYYSLCWNWQFVRLLEDSRQTTAVKAARARIKIILLEFYGELEERGAFSDLKPVPVSSLVKAQLGCGLIVVNSMLEKRGRQFR